MLRQTAKLTLEEINIKFGDEVALQVPEELGLSEKENSRSEDVKEIRVENAREA